MAKDNWDLKNLRNATFKSAATDDTDKPAKEKRTGSRRRQTQCFELTTQYLYRRAYSETQLLNVVDFDYKPGHAYHFLTGGDVDSLSFLKTVLRQQDLDYLLFSTWRMAAEDIRQIDEWMELGKIKKLDAFLGEIFPTTYRIEWAMVLELFQRRQCGKPHISRNHSKIYAGVGQRFAFVIESSANINTNPRTENACITIDRGLFDFTVDFFKKCRYEDERERENQDPDSGAGQDQISDQD
uniref:Uncharacterized protein n=1 Tax=uncultured bacterium fosmid pJB83B9 TaxID=1478070 RepID=A0A0H3UAN1_9BACT|nr:hypothetical protein [uncultured bacterium fosmid pJB83B9]